MTTTRRPSADDGALRDRLLAGVEPWDDLERRHIAEVRGWIAGGASVYRTAKPDVPATHLVSYFVVVDEDQGKLLLVAHRNAGLMLPAGGHVEPMGDPWSAVRPPQPATPPARPRTDVTSRRVESRRTRRVRHMMSG